MKILLVQTSFLGDTVLSTAVISGIKQLHPKSELWMMVAPASRALVERDPLLTGVVVFDKRGAERGWSGLWRKAKALRAMQFDRVYALHKSARTALLLWLARIPERIGFATARLPFLYQRRLARSAALHDVQRNLAILAGEAALESFNAELRLYPPQSKELSEQVREAMGRGGYVVLVPGSAWKTKMWQWQGYRDVAKHFIERGMPVLILGDARECAVAQRVGEGLPVRDLCGRSSIAELLTIIKGAALVVCNDSLALHVASAFKVPTVTIFCATSPRFGFGPWHNHAAVVEKSDLLCKPCRRHGGRYCPTGTESCMRDVSSRQVIEAAEGLLRA